MLSPILRIPTGFINNVNDAAIGQATAPPYAGFSSNFSGQLGKVVEFNDEDIRYNSATGTVYGGKFQYVRLAAASTVPVIGQILFWDTTPGQAAYQVTADETLSSTDVSIMIAGICLTPLITVGNYTIIQISGPCNVMMQASLTDAGAIGSRIYASVAGGADVGFADVLDDGTAATVATVSLMQGRYLGKAIGLPTGGALCTVGLGFTPVYV